MTKPREKTREELQAEIEDGKKKIRQFENREKMLRQKLSKEERIVALTVVRRDVLNIHIHAVVVLSGKLRQDIPDEPLLKLLGSKYHGEHFRAEPLVKDVRNHHYRHYRRALRPEYQIAVVRSD